MRILRLGEAERSSGARVQQATRETGDTILLSEHTMRAVESTDGELEERPNVRLKGKREAVAVYAAALADATPTG